MIHLKIRTWRPIGDDESEEVELGDIIDERDISLGEALELVIGKMMESVCNVGTTIQRLRGMFTTAEDMEVALSHEYYIGKWPPQNEGAIPENGYAYWYSFTPQWSDLEGSIPDLAKLYNAVIVYFLHFEGSRVYLNASPEVRRHFERGKHRGMIVQ